MVVPLRSDHDRARFTSGVAGVDHYFRREALKAHLARTARTYVAESATGSVVGFFSLTPVVLNTAGMSFSNAEAPGYLLAKFGVERGFQSLGHGRSLLLSALGIVSDASTLVGGRALVLDPDASATAFYERFGFRPAKATGRYWMAMADVDNVLRELGPRQ